LPRQARDKTGSGQDRLGASIGKKTTRFPFSYQGDVVDESEPAPVAIHDGREISPPASMETHGFTLTSSPSAVTDWCDKRFLYVCQDRFGTHIGKVVIKHAAGETFRKSDGCTTRKCERQSRRACLVHQQRVCTCLITPYASPGRRISTQRTVRGFGCGRPCGCISVRVLSSNHPAIDT
jgi:hypothetical protein